MEYTIIIFLTSFFETLGLNLLFKPETVSEYIGSFILGAMLGLTFLGSLGLLG